MEKNHKRKLLFDRSKPFRNTSESREPASLAECCQCNNCNNSQITLNIDGSCFVGSYFIMKYVAISMEYCPVVLFHDTLQIGFKKYVWINFVKD